jgi:hypothetical protein
VHDPIAKESGKQQPQDVLRHVRHDGLRRQVLTIDVVNPTGSAIRIQELLR